METVTVDYASAVDGLFGLAGKAIEMIVEQPLLLTFFCAGLVFTGIGIVRKLK